MTKLHYPRFLPPPTVIFGLEPAFEAACIKWPNAIKIYYATGASFMHQNHMIRKRTDEFNLKYSPHPPYPYQRLTTESQRYVLADYIFQIGSEYTVETYPENIRSKIILIRQSNTICEKRSNIPLDLSMKNRNTFLSLVSSGPILKGVDLLIEYFKSHKDYVLHLCGPIDNTFLEDIGGLPQNIIFHGFVNTSSEEFKKIASESMFMIYPSCTEGGMPGSVINAMNYGCIPIVTKWASAGAKGKLGFYIHDLTVSSISEAVDRAERLSENELKSMSKRGREYVLNNFNLEVFESDFKNALTKTIK